MRFSPQNGSSESETHQPRAKTMMGFAKARPILRAIQLRIGRWPITTSPECDRCSPPVRPPPALIEDPRRHQRRGVWIDPVVFRAITIPWNNIIIPRSWPEYGRRDNKPRLWFTNDLGLPRPGFSTRRSKGTQPQGHSESTRDGHYLHASASFTQSAKGRKATQANLLPTCSNDRYCLWRTSAAARTRPACDPKSTSYSPRPMPKIHAKKKQAPPPSPSQRPARRSVGAKDIRASTADGSYRGCRGNAACGLGADEHRLSRDPQAD